MDIKGLIKNFTSKGKSKKMMINILIFILFGILLILIGDITSNLNSKKDKNGKNAKNAIEVTTNSTSISSSSYEEKIKKDLVDTLSMISGVGRVTVMIYFNGGVESIPAININDSDKKTNEKDNQGGTRAINESSRSEAIVLINEGGGTKPFIIRQLNPSIGGVMVVAQGASSIEIREKIHNAVKTVLNLPSHKVTVMPMKN